MSLKDPDYLQEAREEFNKIWEFINSRRRNDKDYREEMIEKHKVGEEAMTKMRDAFNADMDLIFHQRGSEPLWTEPRIELVIALIEHYLSVGNESDEASHRNKECVGAVFDKKYDVAVDKEGNKLLMHREFTEKFRKQIKIAHKEEYFDLLWEAHLVTNHGGRDVMDFYLESQAYIPMNIITLFERHCIVCKEKRVRIDEDYIDPRYRLGFIDILKISYRKGSPVYILYYQDQRTKLSYLRKIESDSLAVISKALVALMIDFPDVLFSSKDRNWTRALTIEMMALLKYPGLAVIAGESREPEGYSKQKLVRLLFDCAKINPHDYWHNIAYMVRCKLNAAIGTPKESTEEDTAEKNTEEKKIKTRASTLMKNKPKEPEKITRVLRRKTREENAEPQPKRRMSVPPPKNDQLKYGEGTSTQVYTNRTPRNIALILQKLKENYKSTDSDDCESD